MERIILFLLYITTFKDSAAWSLAKVNSRKGFVQELNLANLEQNVRMFLKAFFKTSPGGATEQYLIDFLNVDACHECQARLRDLQDVGTRQQNTDSSQQAIPSQLSRLVADCQACSDSISIEDGQQSSAKVKVFFKNAVQRLIEVAQLTAINTL